MSLFSLKRSVLKPHSIKLPVILAMVFVAVPQCVFGASIVYISSTTPMSGNAVWRPIPDPTNPGRFIPSYYTPTGRRLPVLAIPCTGRGTRSVTFVKTGLPSGYYRVEAFYPKHVGNAKNITWQYKRTGDVVFTTMDTKLNQQIGHRADASYDESQFNVVPNSFQSAYQNLTPFKTRDADSYIWVPVVNGGATLSIRFTDGGCYGGRMVASCVRLTNMGNIR